MDAAAETQVKGDAGSTGALRIALIFFGITRSLRHTLGSITKNLIEPARAISSEVRTFGHFFDQASISNRRSREAGTLDRDEYKMLHLDAVELEEPNLCHALYPLEDMKRRGDYWRDDFASFGNLIHQLHSLKRATLLAEAWAPDIVIFARPDLLYHDSAEEYLRKLAKVRRRFALLPNWSQWHGHNDRFAIIKGTEGIAAYGKRADRMEEYCARGKTLHSERLLKFALAGHRVRMIPMRASRVRSNGLQVLEYFEPGRGRLGAQKLVPLGSLPVPTAVPQTTGGV